MIPSNRDTLPPETTTVDGHSRIGTLLTKILVGCSVLVTVAAAPSVAQLTESDRIDHNDQWVASFGWNVAMDGNTIVVGAHNDDEKADNAGAALVYVRSGNTWTFQQKLFAPTPGSADHFGSSVDIWGDFIAVGAINAPGAGTTYGGAAHVFRRIGDTWTHEHAFDASQTLSDDPFDQPHGGDQFGAAIAIRGDIPAQSTGDGVVITLLVGSPEDNHSSVGTDAGSAYLFERSADGTGWNDKGKLIANDPDGSDEFGGAVDLHGDHLVIGATGNDPGGAVYVFVRQGKGGVWGLDEKLEATDNDSVDRFGESVAVHTRNGRATIAVGAPGDGQVASGAGAVYVFEGSIDLYSEQKLVDPGGAMNDSLGRDVDVGSGVVAAVADLAELGYVFAPGGSGWTEWERLVGTDIGRPFSVAVSDDTTILGDPFYDLTIGAVFVFDGLGIEIFSDDFESGNDDAWSP